MLEPSLAIAGPTPPSAVWMTPRWPAKSWPVVRDGRGSDRTRATGIQTVSLASALIGGEEKKLVPPDRAAEIKAELILLQHRPRLAGGIPKEGVRIKVVISEEFPCGTVKIVGSPLCDNIDIRASISSIGSVVLAGLHLEFLDRVRVGDGYSSAKVTAALQIVDSYSIHLNVVVALPSAVRGNGRAT